MLKHMLAYYDRLCHNLVYCELLCHIFSYGMVVLGELNK